MGRHGNLVDHTVHVRRNFASPLRQFLVVLRAILLFLYIYIFFVLCLFFNQVYFIFLRARQNKPGRHSVSSCVLAPTTFLVLFLFCFFPFSVLRRRRAKETGGYLRHGTNTSCETGIDQNRAEAPLLPCPLSVLHQQGGASRRNQTIRQYGTCLFSLPITHQPTFPINSSSSSMKNLDNLAERCDRKCIIRQTTSKKGEMLLANTRDFCGWPKV